MSDPKPLSSYKRTSFILFLTWLAMVGVDFFLHGGLLARFYTRSSPFLLAPDDAFRLIPVGYLSFLILAALLIWLMSRLGITGWRAGIQFGLKIGLLTWGALVLGLISISTADLDLLVGWWLGQSIELGIGAAVIGASNESESLRGITLRVLSFVILLVILTIVMQSFGWAPSTRI